MPSNQSGEIRKCDGPSEVQAQELVDDQKITASQVSHGLFGVDEIMRWGLEAATTVEFLQEEIPGYNVEQLLGKGGMGAVYKGRQLNLERVVAIKLLPMALSCDPEFAERFAREAKAMANLDHPHIVKILEFGKTRSGQLYYAMEYVDGGDLLSALRKSGPMDAVAAIRLLINLCGAMECAHAAGIVHRDIKPANVLLTRTGSPKIADFGLVQSSGQNTVANLTRPGAVLGTPDYMAPEQRNGQPVDARADVYALGVLLYQTITERLPRGAWELPSIICRERGTPCDVRLDAIVRKALQESPVARFPDVKAMGEALVSILSEQTAAKTQPLPPSRAAFAAAAALVCFIGWWLSTTALVRDITSHIRAAVIGIVAPAKKHREVAIVDISRLKPKTQPGGPGTVNATPRDVLLNIIRALAQARPTAIGVDIDFSPHSQTPNQPYTPQDPEFFKSLMQLQQETSVPIFLGVWRQELSGSARWLGGEEFSKMAAGLGIDRPEDRPVETLPLQIRKDQSALPSLSLALALAGGAEFPTSSAPAWLMKRETDPMHFGAASVRDYVANFEDLDELIANHVGGSDPSEIPAIKDRVRGKLVLLSDADLSQRADPFSIPTQRNEPIPGGYVHACGVTTLLAGAPATLTPLGRLLASLVFLGACGFSLWRLEKWIASNSPSLNVGLARNLGRVAIAVVIGACLWGVLRVLRLAWADYLYLGLGWVCLRPTAYWVERIGSFAAQVWRHAMFGVGTR